LYLEFIELIIYSMVKISTKLFPRERYGVSEVIPPRSWGVLRFVGDPRGIVLDDLYAKKKLCRPCIE
jgi:hypothetical protein